MSTTYGTFTDSLDKDFKCEIFAGTGGICIYNWDMQNGTGLKVWLRDEDVDGVIASLQLAQRHRRGGNATP